MTARTNEDRFAWLAALRSNSTHLGRNDEHACNYVSAKEWIQTQTACDEHCEFYDCTADELQRMSETDTIWSLQIYPSTPNGSYRWVAATMAEVIDKAMDAWPGICAEYTSVHNPQAE